MCDEYKYSLMKCSLEQLKSLEKVDKSGNKFLKGKI